MHKTKQFTYINNLNVKLIFRKWLSKKFAPLLYYSSNIKVINNPPKTWIMFILMLLGTSSCVNVT